MFHELARGLNINHTTDMTFHTLYLTGHHAFSVRGLHISSFCKYSSFKCCLKSAAPQPSRPRALRTRLPQRHFLVVNLRVFYFKNIKVWTYFDYSRYRSRYISIYRIKCLRQKEKEKYITLIHSFRLFSVFP